MLPTVLFPDSSRLSCMKMETAIFDTYLPWLHPLDQFSLSLICSSFLKFLLTSFSLISSLLDIRMATWVCPVLNSLIGRLLSFSSQFVSVFFMNSSSCRKQAANPDSLFHHVHVCSGGTTPTIISNS